MAGVIIFNVLMVMLGAGIASQVIPTKLIVPLLSGLHNIVGITMPPPEKVRAFILIWLGFVILLVDGCLFLFIFLASELH